MVSFELASSGPSAPGYRVEIPNPEADDPKNKDKSETVESAGAIRKWAIDNIRQDPKSDGHQRVTK